MILIGWTGRIIAAAWMVAAGAVGFGARAIGRGARDLDPHHRRDGGAADPGCGHRARGLVVGPDGQHGRAGYPYRGGRRVRLPRRGDTGVALLLAWRFLRHPDRNTETVRASIGWTALLLGAAGLIHMAKGTPRPSDGAHRMHEGGGFVGYLMSGPLAAAVSPWAAAALLALLVAYGLLLISGTPVHRIPARLTELRELFGHGQPRTGADDDGLEIDEGYEACTGSTIRRARGQIARQIRLRPAIEAGEHVKPYDTPLVEQDGKRGQGKLAPCVPPGRRRRPDRGARLRRAGGLRPIIPGIPA